jgi:hypothetical protein
MVFKSLGFDDMRVISRQQTNDPGKNTAGPRATPMREILMDPEASEQKKFAVWRGAMSPQISDQEVLDLMRKAESRMKNKVKVKECLGKMRPLLKEGTTEQKIKMLKKLKEMIKETAPIVVMPRLKGSPPSGQLRHPPGMHPAKKQGEEDAKTRKPYSNPYTLKPELGYCGNQDWNQYHAAYNSVKKLDEFAPPGSDGENDGTDIQLYIDVAKKVNMKKYEAGTAHDLIAKKMAGLVDVVEDEKVDYARHVARKAQGMPNMLETQSDEQDPQLSKPIRPFSQVKQIPLNALL